MGKKTKSYARLQKDLDARKSEATKQKQIAEAIEKKNPAIVITLGGTPEQVEAANA